MVSKKFVAKVIAKGWAETREWFYRLNTKVAGKYEVERIPVELMGTTASLDAGEWEIVYEGVC